jgi:hypothetical protein
MDTKNELMNIVFSKKHSEKYQYNILNYSKTNTMYFLKLIIISKLYFQKYNLKNSLIKC